MIADQKIIKRRDREEDSYDPSEGSKHSSSSTSSYNDVDVAEENTKLMCFEDVLKNEELCAEVTML